MPYISLYRFWILDVNCTSACRLPRGCRRNCRKSSTITRKVQFPWKMQSRFGCLSCFVSDEICTCLLYHTRRKLPFPYVGSAGKDRKSAGDVMGHKCARLFDIVYCVCARRCNTPLKYRPIWDLTCHANTTKTPTSKRPPIHHQKYRSNATATPANYLANTTLRTCAIETDTPRGLHQYITDTPPRHHQITTGTPPIHHQDIVDTRKRHHP